MSDAPTLSPDSQRLLDRLRKMHDRRAAMEFEYMVPEPKCEWCEDLGYVFTAPPPSNVVVPCERCNHVLYEKVRTGRAGGRREHVVLHRRDDHDPKRVVEDYNRKQREEMF